ncbi:esterase/lipase family protein [Aquibacillus rhizosphaerae]|uniref:Alpha/beta hydrolase n=1 Tax=Aquibacillus rhizosphaerae TaxID=3051431 RepID=A0ABT7LDD8_9BACI|nr:alpha/beta hydrolase [Aquibacillus sp. LR5S19]MDL4843200.1 alpha/beta hydrolase [Aquibacillus sp. LR5S19]
MLKKLFFIVFLIAFMLPSVTHAGSFGKDDPSGNPGEWYTGTAPAYVTPSKHPILFVHGLNSSSKTWWESNNMYDTALQNGYETAFIDLHPTDDMWSNGDLLAEKMEEMYDYFGEEIIVVAHSKGGVDTQSALVHYDAHPYVKGVITLSTPHYGSQLADLAYSSWAGWLANIIGSKSDATYSLQTGYMDYFRSETDDQAAVSATPFYTFAGTERGSFGSSLYWGGLYLSTYGANDGAVTVSSSRLPYGTEVSVGNWNHTTIKEGSSTFGLFENYLQETGSNESLQAYQDESVAIAATSATSNELLSSIVRGGQCKGKKKESFLIEEGVNEIVIDWISDTKNTNIVLKDSQKNEYDSFTVEADQSNYFNGAFHHMLTIKEPNAGEWTLETTTNKVQSYLLNVAIDSPLNKALTFDLTDKNVKVKTTKKDIKVKTEATVEYYNKNQKLKETKFKITKKSDEIHALPKLGEGVYNLTIDVDGKTGKEKFQRTIIKSVYVDNQGVAHY